MSQWMFRYSTASTKPHRILISFTCCIYSGLCLYRRSCVAYSVLPRTKLNTKVNVNFGLIQTKSMNIIILCRYYI